MSDRRISIKVTNLCDRFNTCEIPGAVYKMMSGIREVDKKLTEYYNTTCLSKGYNCELTKKIGELK